MVSSREWRDTGSRARRLWSLWPTLAISVLTLVAFLPIASGTANFVDRGPIRIDSDQGLNSANGLTGGGGTAENPYLIEGWRIVDLDTSNPIAIIIGNTTAFIVVRGVDVSGAGIGISITNARNVTVSDSRFSNNTFAVSVDHSQDCSIVNNTFTDNHYAVFVFDGSKNTIVKNNVFLRNGFDSSLTIPDWVLLYFGILAGIATVALAVLLPWALKTRFFARPRLKPLRVIVRLLLCVLVQSAVVLIVTGYIMDKVNMDRMQYAMGFALSLVTVIVGITAIIFISLFRSSWVEPFPR
jgi:parallel beta-helix repeat protein